MATISKFYFHDAASPNTGTMPSGAIISNTAGSTVTTGSAPGAPLARDATDTIGTANPDIQSTITSLANTTAQQWGHRRFVSRPLAAQTIPAVTWTLSYADSESNLSHNQNIFLMFYVWRPSGATRIGFIGGAFGVEPTVAATETPTSFTIPGSSLTVLSGDILVFDFSTQFTQGMSTAYTDTFNYDGTIEADTVSCASFASTPSPLTLFTTPTPAPAVSVITRQTTNRSAIW